MFSYKIFTFKFIYASRSQIDFSPDSSVPPVNWFYSYTNIHITIKLPILELISTRKNQFYIDLSINNLRNNLIPHKCKQEINIPSRFGVIYLFLISNPTHMKLQKHLLNIFWTFISWEAKIILPKFISHLRCEQLYYLRYIIKTAKSLYMLICWTNVPPRFKRYFYFCSRKTTNLF